MLVLCAFRRFLHLLQIYNSENFSTNDRRIFIRNSCEAIVMLVAFVSHLMVSSLNGWSCFRNSFDLDRKGQQLVALLSGIQMLLIYVSITKNNRRINYAVERLNNTVKNRKKCS